MFYATTRMKYEAIKKFSPLFDVKRMCEVLGVRRSNYYRWLKAEENRVIRNQDEKEDIKKIEEAFEASDRIC